ncbi:MAG: DNA-binding protein [Methyloceanibacter sp.]
MSKQYLTNQQTRDRYGGKSQMWLWRRLKYDPRFPRPLIIGKRQHFAEDELDAYDEALRAESSANAEAAA